MLTRQRQLTHQHGHLPCSSKKSDLSTSRPSPPPSSDHAHSLFMRSITALGSSRASKAAFSCLHMSWEWQVIGLNVALSELQRAVTINVQALPRQQDHKHSARHSECHQEDKRCHGCSFRPAGGSICQVSSAMNLQMDENTSCASGGGRHFSPHLGLLHCHPTFLDAEFQYLPNSTQALTRWAFMIKCAGGR